MNAQMSANLVDMARPVTKFAARVVHPGSLLRLLRRAIKMAATPPTGPVFLAVPQDILDAPNDEPVVSDRGSDDQGGAGTGSHCRCGGDSLSGGKAFDPDGRRYFPLGGPG